MSQHQSPSVLPHPDHNRYVVSLRNGNQEELAKVYPELLSAFRERYAASGLEKSDREDIFQSAVEDMIYNFYRPEFVLTCPLSAYLSAIYRNKVLDFFRKIKRSPVRLESVQHPSVPPSDTLELAEEAQRQARWRRLLHRSVSQLSDRCQKIFKLTTAKVPAADIALQLKMTNANAVYQARLRCRDTWHRIISQDAEFTACKPEGW